MTLCLTNVSGLKKRKGDEAGGRVRLVDAAWVWTEPHSMRLKVRHLHKFYVLTRVEIFS